MTTESEPLHLTEILVPQSATVFQQQATAEYDVAIATAKRFPRSIDSFLKRAESLATATPEIAASCEYAKPVGGGKVKGPSARLAEIVCATYGNIRVAARILSVTDTEVIAQGVGHDLETNVSQSTEIRENIIDKNGKRYPQHLIATICGSACSKARRNATFLIVPMAVCAGIIKKARMVAAGDEKTLPDRRKALLDWFESKGGVKRPVILAWLGVKSENDIDLELMADLIAAQNSAKEEGISVSEMFSREREGANRFSEDTKGEGSKP
jgi:hypothetical protein